MFYNYKMILVFLLTLLSIAFSQQCSTCPQQCGPNGKCLSCDSGFSLDNTGACGRFTPIEGCQTYSSQTGKCYECFPGNLLQYGICQQLIANCNFTTTNNTDICTQCNDTYVLVNDVNCYSSLTGNCSLGSLPRHLPNGEGFCQIFQIQKCAIPSNDISYCKTCQTNYTNINGVCFNLITQTPCPSNNCNCQFYYYNNICYKFNLQSCLQSKDKIYCDLCNDSLFLVSGRCFEPVKVTDIHCNVLGLNSDICQGCNFQYVLDPNYICVMQFKLCNDPTRTCQQQCNSTSLLYYNGNCYIKDPFCIAYDTVKYQCIECYDGYSLNQFSVCKQTQKCWVYAADGKTCIKCFTGYQLNLNTLNCDKLPYNCKQANTTGSCVSCSIYTSLILQFVPANQTYTSNLSIAINISVCVYSTSNCQYYNIFGFCEICFSSFVQKNHQCIPMVTNCAVPSINDQTKCQICSNGYSLDSTTLTCFPTLEGCLQYSSTKNCISCNTGYSLINGLCFYKDTNCLQYDSNGNCMRCQNSLIPFYNRCVFYDAYCFSYDINGICNKTIGGFSQSVTFNSSMQTNYKSFVSFVRNILQYSPTASTAAVSGDFTQLSIFGGYYTSQGWIRVLPTTGLYHDRILQYDVNGNIRACKDGYTLVNGDCVSRIDYCSQYSYSNGQCVRCLPYYHMSKGRKCVPSTSAICLTPASTGDSCLVCAPSYVLVRGQCYISSLNVISYSFTNSTQISSVENGYFIWSSYQIAWPYDPNCVSQTQPGKCLQCVQQSLYIQSGMRNVNGVCTLVKQNCAKYSPRGICNSCILGYSLHYGICYPNNCLTSPPSSDNCLTCPSLLTYESGLCFNKIQPNCIVYTQIINLNNALTTTTTRSISCLYCSSSYYLTSSNTCNLMITNCLITDSQSGRCTQCIMGYVIYQDNCVKQLAGCQIYNISTGYSTCAKCLTNYNLMNNLCYSLPPRCIKLNSFGACSICQLGYVPVMQNNLSICIFPTSNCITYSVQGRCLVCATNYVLQNNLCNFFIQGCLFMANGSCYQCLNGYYFINGSCLLDQYCVMALAGMCTKCATGFTLVTGSCVKNTIDSCLTQQNDDCLQCASDYQRIALYGRVYCIFSKIIYSGCTTQQYPCLTCLPGFVLDNDGFCYAQHCLYQPTRFSMRVCTACYPYYQLDPTNSFCVLYSCNNSACYNSTIIPQGFQAAKNKRFLIEIQYCLILQDDYSCKQCTNYRFPNLLAQWSLCYPYNCKSNQTCNCSNNCLNYFGNNVVGDNSVCVANNCKVYNTDGTCSVCVNPYIAVSGICLNQGPCTSYNSTTSQCQTCAKGYFVDPSTGLCRLKYCLNHNQQKCVTCNNGFVLDPVNNMYCVPNNCQIYNIGQQICQTCQQGYVQEYNLCVLRNCYVYNNQYICQQCLQGFALSQLNDTLICIKQFPTTCPDGYYFSPTQSSCQPIPINNCSYINPLNTSCCLSCLPNYFLYQGLCYSIDGCMLGMLSYISGCKQCNNGYYMNNGVCVLMPVNCVNVTQNGTCFYCADGYFLQNDICYKFQQNCIVYNATTYLCSACASGFYLNYQFTCQTIPVNCLNSNVYGQCTSCKMNFSLINGICYKYPDYCQTFNTSNLSCLQCITGYQLSSGSCVTNFSTNCLYYNPLSASQCYTCKKAFYEYWINPTTGQINSGLMIVDNFCKTYPDYCTNVDLLGNCISCCYGSKLDNGKCVGTSLRSQNCYSFDNVNMKCLQCMSGYTYCDYLAICIQLNLNCVTYNSLQQCTQCVDGFQLINGDCVPPPPGVSSLNSGICNNGYTYSVTNNSGNSTGSCLRNKNELIKISSFGQYSGTQYKPGQSLDTKLLYCIMYNPPSYVNNYLSILTSNPQIIHYIQIQGSPSGYVTYYLIQYRNKASSPFICWNSCQKVKANINGADIAQLQLLYPIIASEIRLYPLTWVGGIWMRVEMLVERQ